MNKLLIVCGPTATGKTALALTLAKKFSGEIISADSRQIYKGMDIGTGKEIVNSKYQKENVKIMGKKFTIYKIDNISIWLWDVAEPNYKFTVADYLGCVNLVTEDIWRRGKLPIMAGGTGFYIKAAVDGIETLGVPPDWELRKQLSNLEIKKLRRILEGICPERLRGMNKSDRQNPRRLIRAIEIAQKRFMKPVSMRSNTKTKPDILFIGLTAPYRILYSRIDERVRERVRQGVEEEIKTLLKTGYSWKNSVLKMTIGYRQWQNYFNHEGTKEEAIKSWQLAEHGYTRRQMTWFKKDKRIEWFDISSKNWPPKLETLVGKWYNG